MEGNKDGRFFNLFAQSDDFSPTAHKKKRKSGPSGKSHEEQTQGTGKQFL